jgi:hypothetical protein
MLEGWFIRLSNGLIYESSDINEVYEIIIFGEGRDRGSLGVLFNLRSISNISRIFEKIDKMKKLFFTLMVLGAFSVHAQEEDKAAVQKTIEDFFIGFHAQDSMQIKATVAEGIIMQRIALNKEGKVQHRTDDFKKFLKGIVSIPKEQQFEEKITSYSIQVDGPMANAWTGYEFWINGQMHHCGVNSFQLFNDGTGWKIIYIIDTGRKEGC